VGGKVNLYKAIKNLITTFNFSRLTRRELFKKYDYQMNLIVDKLMQNGGISFSRTRNGYIVHTKNRGIIELIGIDNRIQEMVLIPHNKE